MLTIIPWETVCSTYVKGGGGGGGWGVGVGWGGGG